MAERRKSSSRPSIKEFYTGRDVFITGATGFLGKVMVEKLLRSIPDIGNIYILVRQKLGKTSEERLDSLLASRAFEALKEKSSDWKEKIKLMSGALEKPYLGLGEDQLHTIGNVSIIFHIAAIVKFDAPLREALDFNVLGLKNAINVARKIGKNLKAFVHTSTAYAHCDRRRIDEILYPTDVDPSSLLDAKEWMTDHQLELLLPSLLNDLPNTYTFTKKLAEAYLKKEVHDIPVVICRPSIVGAAYKEPFPGWVDAVTGSTGLIAAYGKGLLKVMRVDVQSIADIVPVDMVNNLIIAAAWITAVDKPSHTPVYNFTSLPSNSVTWQELYAIITPYLTNNPMEQLFRRPYGSACKPAFLYPMHHFCSHMIPAFIVDLFLRLRGKKPMMVNIYTKLSKAVTTLEYFTTNRFTWSAQNSEHLWSLMTPEDQEVFYFNLHQLHLQGYFETYCRGIKTFIFKEDMDKVPQARRQITRLRNIRYLFNLLVFLLSARLVYLRSELARQLWTKLLHSLNYLHLLPRQLHLPILS